MKHIFYFSVILCPLFFSGTAPADDAPDNDLDRMLHGVRLNMPFEECLKRLPDAVYSDAALRNTAPDPQKPDALLITYGADPFLGVHAFANIGFQDARIYELVAVWSDEAKDIEARCRRFFKALDERHGAAYEKKSLFVFPGSDQQQAVAVRVWQEADTVTLAFYTPPAENAPSQKASLSFAQFKTGASFLDDVFVNNPVPEEQAAKAWEKAEKLSAAPLP